MDTIIQQPYKGRWDLSRDDVNIGTIYGDNKVGFTARDRFGRTLGYYTTVVEALGAADYAADIQELEDIWALTASPS